MKQDKKPYAKRKSPQKKKGPPIKKDPMVFERAFLARLDRLPVDFIIEQMQSGCLTKLFYLVITSAINSYENMH